MKKVFLMMVFLAFFFAPHLFAAPLTGNWTLEDGIIAVLDPDGDGANIGDEAAGRDDSNLSQPWNEYYWRFDGLIRTEDITGDFINQNDGTGYRTHVILREQGTFKIHGDNLWGQETGTIYEVSIQSRSVGVANYSWDGENWSWASWEGSTHFWGEFKDEPFLFDLTGAVFLDSYGYNSVSGYNVFMGEITNVTMKVSPVPEPATLLLLGTGLIGLAGLGRKFRK